MKALRLVALLLLAISLGVSAQTYRWKDNSGKIQITDTPPPGRHKDALAAGAEPVDPMGGQPFAVRQASTNFPVTLYTAQHCVAECAKARELLNARGIPFSEKLTKTPADDKELLQIFGEIGYPALRVGKQNYLGFEPDSYHKLLDLAGYPQKGKPPAPKENRE